MWAARSTLSNTKGRSRLCGEIRRPSSTGVRHMSRYDQTGAAAGGLAALRSVCSTLSRQ